MSRAQNAYKGLFQKQKAILGTATVTNTISAVAITATAITGTTITGTTITPTTLDLSAKQAITGLSTGIVFADYVDTLPGNVDNGVLAGMLKNSTGVAMFVNSTGTTHKYLLTTTLQPT